ncbi:hypothetical protein BDR04DRAFT_1106507, partial [Suillus decipiens]
SFPLSLPYYRRLSIWSQFLLFTTNSLSLSTLCPSPSLLTHHSQFTAVNYAIRPSLFRQHYSFNLRTLFIFRSYLSKYDATFFYPGPHI